MRSAERRRALLDQVRTDGYLGTAGLSRRYDVDGSTIRRDLAHLERAGLIKRTRGGFLAAEPTDAVDVPYDVRRGADLAEKAAIATAAAALVEDGQSVILDSGSTTYQLALALCRHKRRVFVVTNDLMIAVCLANDPTVRVHVTGGSPVDTAYTLVGPSAVAALEHLHADWTFLGAEAVHHQAGVTNINMVELPVKRAMLAAAERVAVIAPSPSFGRRALAPVCSLDEVSLLLTDDRIPDEERARYGSRLRTVPVTR